MGVLHMPLQVPFIFGFVLGALEDLPYIHPCYSWSRPAVALMEKMKLAYQDFCLIHFSLQLRLRSCA